MAKRSQVVTCSQLALTWPRPSLLQCLFLPLLTLGTYLVLALIAESHLLFATFSDLYNLILL